MESSLGKEKNDFFIFQDVFKSSLQYGCQVSWVYFIVYGLGLTNFVLHSGAYTSHLFKLKLDLGPHDEIPETFETTSHVEFTMPCSTVSQSQIRSIAVTNPNPPEKWVRSIARYNYTIEIEHLDEYPEIMTVGTVYKEAAVTGTKSEEDNEPEERDPRLAVSDSDSSDSD